MASEPYTVRAISPDDWPGVSQKFRDLTYEQSLTYSTVAANRIGATPEFLSVETASGKVVAAAAARVRKIPGLGRGIVWIPSGPLLVPTNDSGPSTESLGAILDALRDHYVRKAGHILRLRLPAISNIDQADVFANHGFMPTENALAYKTVLIDLSKPEEVLWKNLHGKWRNPLRNAMKAGIEIEHLPFTQSHDRFFPLYNQVQQAKGFDPNVGPEFYKDLTGPDFEHDILIAHKDGSDLGAMTIGRSGTSSVYLFGATPDAGRKLNAGYLLMWHSMLWAAKQGCDWFDLGGISIEENPSIARFKLRTGGNEITASGPYEARAKGLGSSSILMAEQIHKRMKRGKAVNERSNLTRFR